MKVVGGVCSRQPAARDGRELECMRADIPWQSIGLAVLLTAGCNEDTARSRDVDGSSTTSDSADATSGDTGPDPQDETGGTDTGDEPPTDDPPNPWERTALRRLTTAQYVNTIRDLLGEQVVVPENLEPDLVLDLYANIGASQVSTSNLGVENFELAAIEIAGQVFSDEEWRQWLVGCDPDVGDCVRQFLTQFGRAAFRRPLTTAEVDRYAAAVAEVTVIQRDPWAGLQYGVAAMLQSPNFLYLIEVGEEDPDTGRIRYTSHEMAARLSYLLWDSLPDATLDARANAGELVEPGVIEEEARRLLSDVRARRAFRRFFDEYLTLAAVESVVKDPEIYPQVTPELLAAMRAEVLRLTEDIAFAHRPLTDLLHANETYVNADLAALYGVAAPTSVDEEGFGIVTLPEPRRGILGSAAFLAVNGRVTRTSPTLRGMFVQSRLLCYDLPPPPPDVTGELPEPPDGSPATMRELLAEHVSNDQCASCHNKVDPIGLALENFDGIGAHRLDDQGLPLDLGGELDGSSFEGIAGLVDVLGADPRVTDCIARQMFRYAVGQVENDELEPIVAALGQRLGEVEHDFVDYTVDLVLSEAFRFRGPVPEEGE
jgi:hypothetical protein